MGSFESTPEYQQSLIMRPACDRVLCKVFNILPENIKRFSKSSELFILDKEFAIDMQVKLQNGTQITGQEKTLSNVFHKYRTFTVEFWQNRYAVPPEPGEFFKIASQFYLHGYSDKTGIEFIEWKIIDVLKFINWLKGYGINELSKRIKPAGGSRASFLPIPYDKIPKSFIIQEYSIC